VDNQVSKSTNPIQLNLTSASTSASSTQSTLNESDKDTSADKVNKPIAPFSRLKNNKRVYTWKRY